MIDLHLHTTASDGTCGPEELVRAAYEAGLRTIAVTDHDTVAGIGPVQTAAAQAGITCLPGIEITAVINERDVHVLGYFIDPSDVALNAFLQAQREDRRRRAVEIAGKLDALGVPIDVAALVASDRGTGKSIGRPLIAAALVSAGHVATIAEAFDRFLGEGMPAYVGRRGASPAEVVERIRRAGGIASFAHPGKFRDDTVIDAMMDAGLGAIEVFHPDHDESATAHYGALARERGLARTGGSDYHGPGSTRAAAFGRISLPEEAYAELIARAGPAAGTAAS